MRATCAAHHAHLYVPLKVKRLQRLHFDFFFALALSAKTQLVLEISRADLSVNEGNRAHSWCFETIRKPANSFFCGLGIFTHPPCIHPEKCIRWARGD